MKKLLELPAAIILTATLVVADNMVVTASPATFNRKVLALPFLADKGILIPTILIAGTLSLLVSQRQADIAKENKRARRNSTTRPFESTETKNLEDFQLSILHKLENLIKSGQASLETDNDQQQQTDHPSLESEKIHSQRVSEQSLNELSIIESSIYSQKHNAAEDEYDFLNRKILSLIKEGTLALQKPSAEHDLLDTVDDLGSDLEFLAFIGTVDSITQHSEYKTNHRISAEFLAYCFFSVLRTVLVTFILFGVTPRTNIFIALFLMYIVHISTVRLSQLLDVPVKQSFSFH